MIKAIHLVFLLILFSCKHEGKPTTESKRQAPPMESPKFKNSPNYSDLMQLTKSEAIRKYGSPHSQEQFILDDLQGEFRIGLYNIYTREERQSESIIIEELTWEKDSIRWITIWYQQSKGKSLPVDSFTWHKGSEF